MNHIEMFGERSQGKVDGPESRQSFESGWSVHFWGFGQSSFAQFHGNFHLDPAKACSLKRFRIGSQSLCSGDNIQKMHSRNQNIFFNSVISSLKNNLGMFETH